MAFLFVRFSQAGEFRDSRIDFEVACLSQGQSTGGLLAHFLPGLSLIVADNFARSKISIVDAQKPQVAVQKRRDLDE